MIDENCHARIERLSRILESRTLIGLVPGEHKHAQHRRQARLLMTGRRRNFCGECRAENANQLRLEGRRNGAGQFHGVYNQLLEAADAGFPVRSDRNRRHNLSVLRLARQGMARQFEQTGGKTPWEAEPPIWQSALIAERAEFAPFF